MTASPATGGLRLGLMAIQVAARSIGVREEPLGSNWGKAVRVYLASIGLFAPASWCAAFVYYKVMQAWHELGHAPQEQLLWIRTGWVPDMYAWARRDGRLLAGPIPGCVFVVARFNFFGTIIGWRHTGFVEKVLGDGTILTIEGNTNDDGSANGIGVFRLRRRISNKLRFIRIEEFSHE